jgi:hypothetical protein
VGELEMLTFSNFLITSRNLNWSRPRLEETYAAFFEELFPFMKLVGTMVVVLVLETGYVSRTDLLQHGQAIIDCSIMPTE